MNYRVYRFKPGLCICQIGDPYAGARLYEVKKISGTEAVIVADGHLVSDQFVYSTVEFADGPSFSLSGVVIGVTEDSATLQWTHSTNAAERFEKALADYAVKSAGEIGSEETASDAGNDSEAAGTPAGEQSVAESSADVTSKAETKQADQAASKKLIVSDPITVKQPSASPRQGAAPPMDSEAPLGSRDPIGARAPSETKERAAKRSRPRGRSAARQPAPGSGAGAPAKKTAGKKKASRKKAPQKKAPRSNTPEIPEAGKIDVTASIKKRTKKVSAAALASRLNTVRILNMQTIRDLIKEAVNEAVVMIGPSLQDREREQLLKQAEVGFNERFKEFQAEKDGLKEQAKRLTSQLDRAQSLLDEERQKIVSADQFTVSDAGIVELETRFKRIIDRTLSVGSIPDDLERDLRDVVSKLLDDERERIADRAQQAQNDKIALLEKKVNRLAGNLEDTSKERDKAQRRAQALEASGGVALRNVVEAGLEDDDPEKGKKLDLLKELLEFNRDIRRSIAGDAPTTKAVAEEKFEEKLEEKTKAVVSDPKDSSDLESMIPAIAPGAALDDTDEDTGIVQLQTAESLEVPQRDDDPSMNEEQDGVPVLAAGDDADPDNQLWEPPAATSTKDTKIRRLG